MWFYGCFWSSLTLVFRVINNFFIQILLLLGVPFVQVSVRKILFVLFITFTFIKQTSMSSIVQVVTMVLQKVSLTKKIPILVTANLFRLSEILRTDRTLETMAMEK